MSVDTTTIKRGRHEAVPLPGIPRSEEEIGRDPQPGDIYRTSWGYDQTNVEFFEVIRRTPGTVTVRRISSRMGEAAHGESPHSVYPAPGVFVRDVLMDGNSEIYRDGEWIPNPNRVLPYSEKVCRLTTKLLKWQKEGDAPYMGQSLTIDDVRTAWPYSSGGAYDTIAAGGMGH